MKKTSYAILLSAFFSLYAPIVLFGAGESAGDFLLVNISARETALGGIFSPYYARPTAAPINPATMAGITDKHIIFSHYTSVFATNYEQLIYAQAVSPADFIGGLFTYDSTLNLQRTDANGYPVEEIENYDVTIGTMYARSITPDWSFGVNLKLLVTRLYKSSSVGGAGNVGFVYQNPDKKYVFGGSVENFGMGSQLQKEKMLYPIIGRIGYGFEILRDASLYHIAAYIEERLYLNQRQAAETSFGLEAAYMNFFTFRYGYVFGRNEGRVALGAGFQIKNLHVDYAYQPFFISDNAHRFTLSVLL